MAELRGCGIRPGEPRAGLPHAGPCAERPVRSLVSRRGAQRPWCEPLGWVGSAQDQDQGPFLPVPARKDTFSRLAASQASCPRKSGPSGAVLWLSRGSCSVEGGFGEEGSGRRVLGGAL